MSNPIPPANTLSLAQRQILAKLSENSSIVHCLLPDSMEAPHQPAGPSAPKPGALPPHSSLQSFKDRVSKLNVREYICARMMMQKAKDNPGWVTQNIGQFHIKNQQKLAEIARECTEKEAWAVAEHIKDFGMKDESSRLEIALKCAQKTPGAVAQYIKNFEIEDEASRLEIALKCAEANSWAVARYIKNFEIEDEAFLLKIALKCAEKASRAVAEHIKDFDIKDEASRIEIALKCAEGAPLAVAEYIKDFDIKDEVSRLKIARECAEKAPGAVAQYIKNAVAQYIKNFDIQDEASRLKIALQCAETNPGAEAVAEHIKDFDIKDEASLLEIALKCAEENSWAVAKYIKDFDIKDEASRLKIALKCVEKAPVAVAQYIKNFEIEDEASRIEIALKCAEKAPQAVAQYIKNFEIENEASRYKIALKCVGKAPWFVLRYIAHFGLLGTDVFAEVMEKYLQENKFLFVALSNHPELSLLRPALHRRGLVGLEKPPAAEGENPLLDDVWRYLENMEISGAGSLPKAERNNLAAAVLQLHDPTMGRKILYLVERNSNDETIVDRYQAIDSLRLQKSLAWEALLRWSLAVLAAQGVSVQGLIEALNTGLYRLFKDKLKARPLLDVLVRIGENQVLSREDKQCVVEELQGIDAVKCIRMLLILKAEQHLIKRDVGLKDRLREAIRENIGEHTDVSAFIANIERSFGKSRNPEAIWQFFASMKQTDESEAMAAFNRYCNSVADGSFLQQRYDTKRSKHWQALVEIAPHNLAAWQKPVECAVNQSAAAIDFDAKAWLKTKIVDDQHLRGFASAELIEFLGGSASSASASAWQPQQAAAFTQACRELASATKRQQHIEKLNDLQRQLIDANFTGELLNDIAGQLQLLTQTPRQSKGGLRGIDTDNPYHLLLCGTEVAGSCQRVDGDPDLNKGLLGYLLHGQTRLLAVVDAQERIVTRALLRLLIGQTPNGESYPVLFLERIYGNPAHESTLQTLAQQKAAAMGLRVAHLGNSAKTHDNMPPPLQSLGGPAPYEYCDASRGVCANGEFTIEDAVWLDTAVSARG